MDVSCFHSHEMVTKVTHFTFEEHKNDGQKIVVIDAGHGGNDPGTHGKHSKEKDIALQIALKLGEKISGASDEIKVIYTRDKDVFIPLHKRIGLANKKKADLFVSIHCNYVGNPNICGTETYVMGLHRAEDNLNVAKRENSSILLESEYETHYEGYDPNSPVGHILLSMIQNVFIDNSIDLASKIEEEFIDRKKTKSRGVKQAGFVVLREATMPSILVETGFLSNAKEEKYLMSEDGQNEMATGIQNGIFDYFQVQKSTNTVSKPTVAKKDKPSITNVDGKYIIQIGAFSKKKDKKYESALDKYGTLVVIQTNKVFKYAVGYFLTKEDATAVLQDMKKNGYTDAFVKIGK